MDDNDNKLKKIIVKLAKKFFTKVLSKILIPILIVFIIFSSVVYYITVDDAVYKEDDLSNAPYAVSQYTDNVDIGNDGQISSSMTAQELWELMDENDNRGLLYLDTPEELLKLMNAELVTQYLDTRSNPDEEIDWDLMNDVNSKDIQGIVKLKRADAENNTSTMTYVEPDVFQSYIEQYNKSGAEEAKKLALSHFTLEQTSSSSNSSEADDIGIIQGTGTFTQYTDLTDQQIKAIANLCKQEQGSLKGAAAEASLMANRFELVGSKFGTGANGLYNYVRNSRWFAHAVDFMDNGNAGQDYVDVVKAVLVNGKRTLPKYVDEHDCFTDISNATNSGSSISVSERSQYKQYVTNISNRYGAKYIFFCFPTDTSDPFGYTSKKNRKKYGDAYYDFDTGQLINGTENASEDQSENQSNKQSEDSLNEWYWPTDGTTITSKFGPRDAPVAGASTDHGGIDIGIVEGTNVYACDAGKVTTAGYSDSAGNWVVIDHGNGYITKYMHNSQLKVSQGDTVKKGQVIALSGNTGNSSGPHLHFQVEYNGEKKDPLKFKYNNGMGDGSIGVKSNSDSTSENNQDSNASKWYAKVATWNEERTIIESNDPSVSESDVTIYNMTSTNINYQDVVSGYTMPFEYLWALLVITEDKDFVLELADLVYNSEIEITVHDNLTINTETEVNTYTRKKKTDTEAEVTIRYGKTTSFMDGATTESGSWTDEESNDYKVTETVINKNNTLDICLTKANVWMLEYTQEYTYKKPNVTSTGPTIQNLDDEKYPNTPDSTSQDDTYGHAQNLFESQKKKYEETYDYVNGSINSVEAKIYNAVINKKRETSYKMETTNYVSSPAKTREKTENSKDENNFITIFRKSEHKGAREKILDVTSWLFEILESNDSTKDKMVDLTKYLLYKATGKNYGVTEYDFSEFDNNSFMDISGNYGDWDGTGSTEDFIKAVAPYAVADMQEHKIYASVTIAQAIIESGWGKDSIAIKYKNFFGMKASGLNSSGNEYWDGTGVCLIASEGGESYFRVYDSLKNSIFDHGRNFHVTATYKTHGVLECIDKNLGPKEQLRRIAISGYAVYRDGSISRPDGVRTYDIYLYEEFIKKYNLEQYDKMTIDDFESVDGNQDIVEIAKSKLGSPYQLGARGPNKFDCSGFVYWVYGKMNITVPTTTDGYKSYKNTKKEITWSEAQPGDILLIFNTERTSAYGHAGIYLGNDEYIHAPQTGDVVKISKGAKSKFKHVFRFK